VDQNQSNHISFAVGSKHGPRSARWIVSVSDHEIYVTTAKSRRLWHVSLHSSGRWHLKQHRRRGQDEEIVLKGHRRDMRQGEYPIGLYIAIPDSCLRPASDPDRTSVPDLWLDRPQERGVVEIALMKWDVREIAEEWPGRSVGVKLLLVYRLSEQIVVGVLLRYLTADNPIAISIDDKVDSVSSSKTKVILDSPERRGYISAETVTGALCISEFAID
jgi:hypothetical protein